MTILTAWSCVLSRMSGQDDIIIGSPSANRNHLIGFFVNTLALRIDLTGSPTMRQLLERVQKTSLDAQNHQDLPFEQVVDIVQLPQSLSHTPLFQVMFVLQNNEMTDLQLPGLEITNVDTGYDVAKFDLTLGLFELEDGVMGSMSYSTALFDRVTVVRHVGYLCSMLREMLVDVDRLAMSVDLLSPAERELVLGEWNDTQQDYPLELCIHHLFEQQVERTPQATALVFDGQSLTYAELNELANRLAYQLIILGVQPESVVAICAERSVAMVAGVLAILKAGKAYIPPDPSYASDRLRDILLDSSPHIVVADTLGQQALGEGVQTSWRQNRAQTASSYESHFSGGKSVNSLTNPQVAGLTSSNLAYIIYTSGSTGKPKGVMVEHRGLSNLVYGIRTSCSSFHSPLTAVPVLGFSGDVVPIGRPIASKCIYILDEHRQLVPLGATGELYIGGAGVARGYLNRPDLTAQVFLRDPFSGEQDARMYKTGDQARYLADGNIVFLGRNDHQVKIRGFRIELGEIEARLTEHMLVHLAAVIAMGEESARKLVAYVVAKHHDQLVHTLRSYLRLCLPDYMVPAAFVRLDSLPLNSNGKLDRKALPAPDNEAFAHHFHEEPHGEVETTMARIWSELLHLDVVSRHDNFFSLGGHSLLAVQLIERLRCVGLTLTIRHLFSTPTLSALARS
ncbi:acetyl-CoA synthetase-like protein, partial [Basidiobolus meristosporus CBS 931.73]